MPERRERLQVRTYDNGWVFSHFDFAWNDQLRDLALNALRALDRAGLGAVDLAAKFRRGRMQDAVVVEVNSAPGLRSETTLERYTQAMRNLT